MFFLKRIEEAWDNSIPEESSEFYQEEINETIYLKHLILTRIYGANKCSELFIILATLGKSRSYAEKQVCAVKYPNFLVRVWKGGGGEEFGHK